MFQSVGLLTAQYLDLLIESTDFLPVKTLSSSQNANIISDSHRPITLKIMRLIPPHPDVPF